MSDTAIRVKNLGKRYQLGAAKSGSFRESLTGLFRRNGSSRHSEDQPASSIQHLANQQDFWALQDINFEIKRGEAVGIIGRNGAGKSTLLKILSRITEPTTGRYEIFGRVSSLLEVGTGFHPELTGRENVYLNGTILGMKRREVRAKFDEIVAFSGVEKFIDTPVKHYSSGMQVRLAFAVAAHLEPEILIIDEVLAVGDAEFQKKCLGKMEDVTGEGRTVLFVSHNMGAVQKLCSRGIYLSGGNKALDDNIQKVVADYLESGNSVLNGELASNKSKTLILREITYLNGVVRIKLLAKEEFGNVALVLTIADSLGNTIFKTSSAPIWSSATFSISADQESTFEVDINELKLISGRYKLSFAVTIPNVEYLLQLDNAISINIENPSMYEGTKVLIAGTDGYIMVPHSWKKLC